MRTHKSTFQKWREVPAKEISKYSIISSYGVDQKYFYVSLIMKSRERAIDFFKPLGNFGSILYLNIRSETNEGRYDKSKMAAIVKQTFMKSVKRGRISRCICQDKWYKQERQKRTINDGTSWYRERKRTGNGNVKGGREVQGARQTREPIRRCPLVPPFQRLIPFAFIQRNYRRDPSLNSKWTYFQILH